ncbi:hypothetical protein Sjap_008341 [Stephania japonica]|uniref:Uncharacterized protein n=1 Tax=Stephania japonica TaxID=461633 RepID=A0AAP0JRP5_9MAGN
MLQGPKSPLVNWSKGPVDRVKRDGGARALHPHDHGGESNSPPLAVCLQPPSGPDHTGGVLVAGQKVAALWPAAMEAAVGDQRWWKPPFFPLFPRDSEPQRWRTS